MQDRNFDDLADKFSQNIYGTTKGKIRQAILWDELEKILPGLSPHPLSVLDAGGGVGQVSSGLCCAGPSGSAVRPFQRDAAPGRGKCGGAGCEPQHAIQTN